MTTFARLAGSRGSALSVVKKLTAQDTSLNSLRRVGAKNHLWPEFWRSRHELAFAQTRARFSPPEFWPEMGASESALISK